MSCVTFDIYSISSNDRYACIGKDITHSDKRFVFSRLSDEIGNFLYGFWQCMETKRDKDYLEKYYKNING